MPIELSMLYLFDDINSVFHIFCGVVIIVVPNQYLFQ